MTSKENGFTFGSKIGNNVAELNHSLDSLLEIVYRLRNEIQPVMEDEAPNLEPACIFAELAIDSLSGMLTRYGITPNPIYAREPALDMDSRELVKDSLLPLTEYVNEIPSQLRTNIQPELGGAGWKMEKSCILSEALQTEFRRLLGVDETDRHHLSARCSEVDRETFAYGVAVNRVSGAAYAFNRDYFVLPNTPYPAVVLDYKENGKDRSFGLARGEGRYKPEIEDETQWDTYWIHPGKYPIFKNANYDRSKYK